MADAICGRIILKLSRCEFGAIVKDQMFWKAISTVLDVVDNLKPLGMAIHSDKESIKGSIKVKVHPLP